MPESRIQMTSYQSLCAPNPQSPVTSHSSLLSNFFGGIPSPYHHRKRNRGIFLALQSVSHKHIQGNDALVLRISTFTHPSLIGLQGRFLAYARNDDTRESQVTSHLRPLNPEPHRVSYNGKTGGRNEIVSAARLLRGGWREAPHRPR